MIIRTVALLALLASATPSAARAQATTPTERAPGHVLGMLLVNDKSVSAGSKVRLVDVGSGATVATTTTDADGHFSFPPCAPGRYRVDYINNDNRILVGGHVFALAPGESVATLVEGHAAVIPSGSVVGTLRAPSGPVADGTLQLRDAGTMVVAATARTDRSGAFTFDEAAPSVYFVECVDPKTGRVLGTSRPAIVPATPNAIADVWIEATSAPASTSFGRVHGYLLSDAGRPIPGGRVELRDVVTKKIVLVAVTDKDGEFLMAQVAPGRYVVEHVADSDRRVLGTGPELRLGAGEERSSLIVAAQRTPLADRMTTAFIPVKVGDKVWIAGPDGWDFKGVVAEVTPTSVDVDGDTGSKRFAAGDITRVSKPDSNWSGFRIGAAIGVGVGLLGASRSTRAAYALAQGALYGVIGAAFDSANEEKDVVWERSRASSVTLSPVVQARGLGLSGSISWR